MQTVIANKPQHTLRDFTQSTDYDINRDGRILVDVSGADAIVIGSKGYQYHWQDSVKLTDPYMIEVMQHFGIEKLS